MGQIHKRFTDEQVRLLMQSYDQGQLRREEVQELLGIGRSRFFALLKDHRRDPAGFSIAYQRAAPARLSADVEAEMTQALLREKEIVEDPNLPISGYNYTAIKDRLAAKGISVSVTTIIKRAKQLDCYKPRKKHKTHDQLVLAASTRALMPWRSLRSITKVIGSVNPRHPMMLPRVGS